MMEQQTLQGHFRGYTPIAFLAGMVVIGVVWIGVSVYSGTVGYKSSISYDSTNSPGLAIMPNKGGNSFQVSTAPTQIVGNMTQDRKATSNYLSVHVANVQKFDADMSAFVDSVSGKVMNEYVTVSSSDQSESGTLTVLVPNKESQKFFDLVSNKAIKVVDRQVTSYEITQEYTDIDRELAQYEVTYAKILKFYDKATTVNDLLQVQNQLTQVQSNIDALKGRKSALDELSNNTQYTLYSSTNEYNLPYIPQGTFEFAKTFKLAVRSLIATTDKILMGAIYVLVYVPILALLGLIVWAVKKYAFKR